LIEPATRSPAGKGFRPLEQLHLERLLRLCPQSRAGAPKNRLKKDDAIALIGDNIPEMLFVAIGAQAVGGISAAIYQTTMPDEIAQLLDYMNVTMVFLRRPGAGRQDRRNQGPGAQVRHVIYEDPRGMRDYRATTGL
jgi:acyl-coenzyme A synthetase/AMP-(fatty) acid ligase